jgi:hypothetical protein
MPQLRRSFARVGGVGLAIGAAAAYVALVSCSSNDAATADDTGGEAGPDTAASTPATDGAPVADAGPLVPPIFQFLDASFSLDAGCLPSPVSDLVPVGIHEIILPACTDDQINAVANSCINRTADCNTVISNPANAACIGCLFSGYSETPIRLDAGPDGTAVVPPASSHWGPLVEVFDEAFGGVDLFNAGACLALTDPAHAGCGQGLDALQQCAVAACAPTCSLPRGSDPPATQVAKASDFVNCIHLAALSACADLATPCSGLDASAALSCVTVLTSGGVAAFQAAAHLQCGVPGDGG